MERLVKRRAKLGSLGGASGPELTGKAFCFIVRKASKLSNSNAMGGRLVSGIDKVSRSFVK